MLRPSIFGRGIF
jgi:hypothetical protein